jgi:hypothetical protein
LRYFIVSGGDMTGLRAAVTLEPTWQVWRGLSLGVGFGYTGLLGSRREQRFYTDRLMARVRRAAEEERDTALPPFNDCDGDGVAALARVSYMWPLGQLFSTGGMAYVDESVVRCRDESFVVWDAERIEVLRVFHQWWPQTSVGLAWVFAWR